MTIDRREFIRTAALGAAAYSGAHQALAAGNAGRPRQDLPRVVVVGAGAFGMWTALHLNRLGASVVVADAYGPGNSRSSSGGETRGVRSSYGDQEHGLLWTRWATESMRRWTAWDEEHSDRLLPRLFYNTGDLILREERTESLQRSAANWDTLGIPYEFLDADEIQYRWPWIRLDGFETGLYEPGAGVVRARRSIESVAEVFLEEGGTIQLGRAAMGDRAGGSLSTVRLEDGTSLGAAQFVFACGPWLPKMFPDLMERPYTNPHGPRVLFRRSTRRPAMVLPEHAEFRHSRDDRLAHVRS